MNLKTLKKIATVGLCLSLAGLQASCTGSENRGQQQSVVHGGDKSSQEQDKELCRIDYLKAALVTAGWVFGSVCAGGNIMRALGRDNPDPHVATLSVVRPSVDMLSESDAPERSVRISVVEESSGAHIYSDVGNLLGVYDAQLGVLRTYDESVSGDNLFRAQKPQRFQKAKRGSPTVTLDWVTHDQRTAVRVTLQSKELNKPNDHRLKIQEFTTEGEPLPPLDITLSVPKSDSQFLENFSQISVNENQWKDYWTAKQGHHLDGQQSVGNVFGGLIGASTAAPIAALTLMLLAKSQEEDEGPKD